MMKRPLTYRLAPQCQRCTYGQLVRDWDGIVCLQCGFRPEDTANAQGKIPGHREPRPPTGKRTT